MATPPAAASTVPANFFDQAISLYQSIINPASNEDELTIALNELVKAVAGRSMNAPAPHNQAGLDLTTEKALENFYQAFEKRATQAGLSKDSKDFVVFAEIAQKMIRNANYRIRTPDLALQIETTVAKFIEITVIAMMDELAGKKTLDQITPDNFKSTVAAISKVAKGQSPANIEADLRRKIKEKHGSEFLPLIEEFKNLNLSRYQTLKAQIENALNAQQEIERAKETAINTELAPLTGDNGWNGSVDAAYRAKDNALAEYNAAEAAYVSLRFVGAPSVTRRALLTMGPNPSAELSAAHTDVLAKLRTLEAAETVFDVLNQECHTLIAERTTIQSKLRQIENDLAPYQVIHDLKAKHGLLRAKEKRIKDQLRSVRGNCNEIAQAAWGALNKAKEELGQDPANVSKSQAFNAAEAAYRVIADASKILFKELATVQREMREIENILPTKIELPFKLLREKNISFYLELNNPVD